MNRLKCLVCYEVYGPTAGMSVAVGDAVLSLAAPDGLTASLIDAIKEEVLEDCRRTAVVRGERWPADATLVLRSVVKLDG